MKFFKRMIRHFFLLSYVLKIKIGKFVFGIDYIAQQLIICSPRATYFLLREGGAILGKNISFKNGIVIDNACSDKDSTGDFSRLCIKDRCYIGKNVFFDLPERIQINEECVISAGVMFVTHQDCGGRLMSKWYPRKTCPIVIGRGSWIGAGATILPGVILGEFCVVGAGSVVNSSFSSFSVVAGSPAKLIKVLKN